VDAAALGEDDGELGGSRSERRRTASSGKGGGDLGDGLR